MNINGRVIANWTRPYVIAEASCNHCGKFDKAMDLIRAAKEAGADAVKFQAYTPDTITIDCDKDDFRIKEGLWAGQTLYQLYKKTYTPLEWFPRLFAEADAVGITVFASVFDRSSVDLLTRLNCPAYKIASMEIVDTPLIRYAAATGRPLIISTGMASEKEVVAAVRASRRKDTAVLACVSSYPASDSNSGLSRITKLKGVCDVVGLSDHTSGNTAAVAATAMGAAVIEKHLCLDRFDNTEDVEFSMDPYDFADMIHHIAATFGSMHSTTHHEEAMQPLRRSLYAVDDIKQGERFTVKNVRSIRPGYGAKPSDWVLLANKKAPFDIERGTAITLEMLK